ncbi:MAG: hypothetical protein DBX52_07315 [Clostridiales bacterium]|nr:MAG: hypothetical protein DBX52_07315 [Clostridiales bacterium]
MKDTICPCRRAGCPRIGDCGACREYHQKHQKIAVACDRLAEKAAREYPVRRLEEAEQMQALRLAEDVFLKTVAPGYTAEGIENYRRTLRDPEYTGTLCFYGAFRKERLIGMLATRGGGGHIALFFIAGRYRHKGLGRRLFQLAEKDCPYEKITVNAAPGAAAVYRSLGFAETAGEQHDHGMRYLPMARPVYHERGKEQ